MKKQGGSAAGIPRPATESQPSANGSGSPKDPVRINCDFIFGQMDYVYSIFRFYCPTSQQKIFCEASACAVWPPIAHNFFRPSGGSDGSSVAAATFLLPTAGLLNTTSQIEILLHCLLDANLVSLPSRTLIMMSTVPPVAMLAMLSAATVAPVHSTLSALT